MASGWEFGQTPVPTHCLHLPTGEELRCNGISRPSLFGCIPKHLQEFVWLERLDEVLVESCIQDGTAILRPAISSQSDQKNFVFCQ